MTTNKLDLDPVHLGESTEDDPVAVTIIRGSDGKPQALFLPRSISRLTPDGKQAIADLQSVVAQLQKLQLLLDAAVAEAREAGASWEAIGWSVGTTGNAAMRRWKQDE
jgi:hypothetical protein